MQTALRNPIPETSLAVFPVNGENSHQGFEGRNPAPHPVREACKFTVLLGLRGQAELNRIGSRCTGKERDAESGLDYFGARYYASNMGRWMSPDWADKPEPVPYSSLDNPQSLNLYGYVLNNPLSKDDPDGHCCEWAKQKYAQVQKWEGDHPRTVAAMKATGAAIVTVAAVATIVATAPVSVPVTLGAAAASALTTTAVAITGTGAAVATVAYTGAAITGDQNLSQAADAVQTVTNPVGMAVTIGSGGNLEMGSKAAAVSDLLTGGKDMLSHAEAGASTAAAATQHAGGAATAGAAAATLAPEPKKDEHK